ncbi:hypothetical protein B566_EDAN008196 [Ephemera danica]|nr:hypothetical protein B566_EDAN008196 [Ephemera danica]
MSQKLTGLGVVEVDSNDSIGLNTISDSPRLPRTASDPEQATNECRELRGHPVFTDRGTINIQSIRSGAVVLNQNPLTSEERAKLKMLKENDGLYRLRSVATTAGGKKFSFLTFTKGAALFDSQLSDILTVSLDSSGNPVSINQATSLSMTEEPISEHKLQQFNTTVFVKHMEQGPTPDTAAYIQKIEQEKMARDRGETKDNRSFFAKYWMYIVPVVIFVLISSATNPEAGAAAGAR